MDSNTKNNNSAANDKTVESITVQLLAYTSWKMQSDNCAFTAA